MAPRSTAHNHETLITYPSDIWPQSSSEAALAIS